MVDGTGTVSTIVGTATITGSKFFYPTTLSYSDERVDKRTEALEKRLDAQALEIENLKAEVEMLRRDPDLQALLKEWRELKEKKSYADEVARAKEYLERIVHHKKLALETSAYAKGESAWKEKPF